jgi:hypothetical protein
VDIGPLRSLVLDSNWAIYGVDAVVTRPAPDDTPITDVRVLWVTPTTEDVPVGGTWQRREMRPVMALRRSEVPTAPRGTRIVAPPRGSDTSQTWQVEGIEREEAEHIRVTVMAVEV